MKNVRVPSHTNNSLNWRKRWINQDRHIENQKFSQICHFLIKIYNTKKNQENLKGHEDMC